MGRTLRGRTRGVARKATSPLSSTSIGASRSDGLPTSREDAPGVRRRNNQRACVAARRVIVGMPPSPPLLPARSLRLPPRSLRLRPARRGWPLAGSRSLASVGPLPDPGLDLGPGALGRAAPGHQADVTSGHTQFLLVRAADLLQQARRLAGRRDVIVLGNDVEQARLELLQIDLLAANGERSVDELVAAVEVDDELPVRAARQRD